MLVYRRPLVRDETRLAVLELLLLTVLVLLPDEALLAFVLFLGRLVVGESTETRVLRAEKPSSSGNAPVCGLLTIVIKSPPFVGGPMVANMSRALSKLKDGDETGESTRLLAEKASWSSPPIEMRSEAVRQRLTAAVAVSPQVSVPEPDAADFLLWL